MKKMLGVSSGEHEIFTGDFTKSGANLFVVTEGGSLVAFTRDYKRGRGLRGLFYGCSYNHKRGPAVCKNRVLIRQDKLDQVVLDAIAEALDERILERAVEKATARLMRLRRSAPDRRAQVERDLAEVDARIQRGLDALLTGIDAARLDAYPVLPHFHERRVTLVPVPV